MGSRMTDLHALSDQALSARFLEVCGHRVDTMNSELHYQPSKNRASSVWHLVPDLTAEHEQGRVVRLHRESGLLEGLSMREVYDIMIAPNPGRALMLAACTAGSEE